ncbi:MAG: AraC family transcriptional regulator ligand-binding domain-containing protein [Halioglobus sp.]
MLTISPIYARYVLRELQRRELNTKTFFEGTALCEDSLQSSDFITLSDFNQLLENGRSPLNDELGLIIGRQVNVMTLGSVGVAAASAPTLRDGLHAIESFSRLHAAQIAVEIRSNLQGVNGLMHFVKELGEVARFHAESGALLLQSYAEMVSGEQIHDAEYRMHFARPAYAEKYSRYFHSPVSFGWPTSSIELPKHWLDRPSPYYQQEVWQQSQLALEARLREYGGLSGHGFSGYVLSCLRASQLPLPNLALIAQRLNVSSRTLNRRLKDEGTSFRELRNNVLCEWAIRYLSESDVSVEAIATALGYDDASNFRRAFKKWTGDSPGCYRNTLVEQKPE